MPTTIPGFDHELATALMHVRAVINVMEQGSAYSPQDLAAKRGRRTAAVDALIARLTGGQHQQLAPLSRLARFNDLELLKEALGHQIDSSELCAFLLDGTLPQREVSADTAPDG
jgi:hypothetical protein